MPRHFYRTIIQIEILSEDEPVGDGRDLEDINYEITVGHCSGRVCTIEEKELSADEMGRALIDQGSDPEFFNIGAAEGIGGRITYVDLAEDGD